MNGTQFPEIAFPQPAQESLLEALLDDISCRAIDQLHRETDRRAQSSTTSHILRRHFAHVGDVQLVDFLTKADRDLLCSLRLACKRWCADVTASIAWLLVGMQFGHNRHATVLDTRTMVTNIDVYRTSATGLDFSNAPRMGYRRGISCVIASHNESAGAATAHFATRPVLICGLTALSSAFPHVVRAICDAAAVSPSEITQLQPREQPLVFLPPPPPGPVQLPPPPTRPQPLETSHCFSRAPQPRATQSKQSHDDPFDRFFGVHAPPRIERRFKFVSCAVSTGYKTVIWVFEMFCFKNNRKIFCVFTIYDMRRSKGAAVCWARRLAVGLEAPAVNVVCVTGVVTHYFRCRFFLLVFLRTSAMLARASRMRHIAPSMADRFVGIVLHLRAMSLT